MYSPYAVAGYLPVAPELIQTHLLQLLAAGEAVLPVHGTDTFVLWRKSLLDPAWSPVPEPGARDPGYGITLVDFAAELFGLSTLWLGSDFFRNNSDHWPAKTDDSDGSVGASVVIHRNTSNLNSGKAPPNGQSPWIVALGTFSTVEACGKACVAWRNASAAQDRCRSFTNAVGDSPNTVSAAGPVASSSIEKPQRKLLCFRPAGGTLTRSGCRCTPRRWTAARCSGLAPPPSTVRSTASASPARARAPRRGRGTDVRR